MLFDAWEEFISQDMVSEAIKRLRNRVKKLSKSEAFNFNLEETGINQLEGKHTDYFRHQDGLDKGAKLADELGRVLGYLKAEVTYLDRADDAIEAMWKSHVAQMGDKSPEWKVLAIFDARSWDDWGETLADAKGLVQGLEARLRALECSASQRQSVLRSIVGS